MGLISCVNILTSFLVLIVILPSQLEAYYTPNTGCHHNGTWYADKSLVPTTEKCLNCQCSKKTLVCRLKVCPEMPMPPPRGCVVVQKKNTCCPYLSCARLDAFYKIPATRRIIAYLDHYERESIDRVVNENMLQRRSDDTDVDLYVCVKNGTVYKSGSAMSSSNLCSYCYCIGGSEKCVKPKCMLPVDGCKPIFVDSTCCPVRYDCSTKQTGKSSQEVRYRKTSNKHYLRMSQRLQRNRGCTVGQQFYVEGQKMKSDKDKPCDICFCIRGQRKCAPKKCAPALRNCMPVVPKGQCCPSSYDCGSQRDYRRSQNSRQFNLFSLLFGKDAEQDENVVTEIPVYYPHDRDPNLVRPIKQKKATTEKSIFDTIREGLEFIDSNNNQMLKDNDDLLTNTKHVRPSPTPIPLGALSMSSTTEVSFLDLLLGPSEANSHEAEKLSEDIETIEEKATPTSTALSWVDLLLGPDEEGSLENSTSISLEKEDNASTFRPQEETDLESTTSIDRVDPENTITNQETLGELEAEEQENLSMTTTEEPTTIDEFVTNEETTLTYPTTVSETTEVIKSTQPTITTTTRIPTSIPSRPSTAATVTTKSSLKTKSQPTKPVLEVSKNATHHKPDFLAQLLDGLSDIFVGENKTRLNNQKPLNLKLSLNKTTPTNPTTTTTEKLHTAKPMPMFKPLPADKTYTRINSKIANLTIKPPIILNKEIIKTTFIPLAPTESKQNEPNKQPLLQTTEKLESTTTAAPISTTPKEITSSSSTTTTTTSTTIAPTTNRPITASTAAILNPVVIKTNPTILEAEPLDENLAPTLPPSLPNLKIIPFLPADAVKSDHNTGSSYDFYHHSAAPISRIDYDLYDDANLYPSITEKYPLYPDLEDGSKAEYIYKFNVEGPDSLVSSNAGKFDGTLASPAFVKYDFVGANAPASMKGFSPPTKTEGGFVPKEPLILDDDDHDNVSVKVGDSYQVTHHIIDITTPSAIVVNTTKLIEITTPDPFKDVIRTEPPPDLTSLIEDKLKNLINKSNLTTMITTNQFNEKPQNILETKTNSKQTDTNPMNTKIENQIQIEQKFTMNSNDKDSNYDMRNNGSAKAGDTGDKSVGQHKESIIVSVDMVDEGNVDVKDVTTVPPFKTLPTAALVVQKQFIEGSTTRPLSVSIETHTVPVLKLKRKQTTTTTTMKTTKRPTTNTTSTTSKVNRNKTNATTTITDQQINKTQSPQKPLKIKNPASEHGSEKKILSSMSTSSSTSALSSLSTTSGGSVSTIKPIKSNATRRTASSKPTKHNNKTTTMTNNKNTTITMNQVKGTIKANVINIDRTSLTTSRRTAKPTANANTSVINAKKKIATGVASTIISKPIEATTRTTTLGTTTTETAPSPSPSPTPSPFAYHVKTETTVRPFFMSPFDKLPFMDASFEVKCSSARPSLTTDAANFPSLQQHFAVQANIADAHYGQDVDTDIASPSTTSSSRHKLMGLVHYKHTLNQLEGLEPSATEQQQQHSSLAFSQFSPVSSPSSSSTTSTSASVSASSSSSSSSSQNNLIDPTGILKLAGCNIYGRMYRVGRIILELSSPCLECKCTEIGVKCGPLDC